jgi:hypothetical protein
MTSSDQKQLRHHRDAKGLLNAICRTAHLVFTQSQVTRELAIDVLHWPTALVATHHVSRRQFGQIGHQDFRFIRAHVTPFFTQNHGDVTDVTKTQAFAVPPERFAPLSARQTRNPSAFVVFFGHRRHHIFDRFVIPFSQNIRTCFIMVT